MAHVCITNRYHVTYDSGENSPGSNKSMCLHYEKLPRYLWELRAFNKWQHQYVTALPTVPCYVRQWRIFTRWQHHYMSALRTVTMLCMAEESIHQMVTLVCVWIANSYHVAYESGEYSPDGNISMCLHYEELSCYVGQRRIFTKWQHQYVSALRTVTMLRIRVESIHQMAISAFVCITNSFHITYDSGEYSPNGNIRMWHHYEMLPC